MPRLQPSLALGITLLALLVVLLGAYTRVTGSGLGCPDWPGCYGSIGVPDGAPAVDLPGMQSPRPVGRLLR